MAKELEKGLEIVFLIHFILGLILGFVFLFIPEVYCNLVGYTITDKGSFRLIGAASLAFGFSSFLAYRSKDWEKAKQLVQIDIVWLVSASGATIFWIISESLHVAAWGIFVMFMAFLIAFGYFYLLQEK